MKRVLGIGLSIALPFSAAAATVAAWNIEGVELDDGAHTPPYTLGANTTAQHIASATLSLSSSVNRSTTIDQYGFKISVGNEQSTLAGAITAGHYIEIAIEVADAYYMHLSSIDLFGQSSGTGCDNVAVLTDVDGFADGSALASVTGIQDVTGGFDTDADGFGGPIDLSDTRFRERRSMTVRIYGWNSSSGSGVTYIRDLSGHDLVINGIVERIPTPGTIVFVR